jgi:hypothetical protein
MVSGTLRGAGLVLCNTAAVPQNDSHECQNEWMTTGFAAIFMCSQVTYEFPR